MILFRVDGNHMIEIMSSARSLRQLLGFTRDVKGELILETDDEILIRMLREYESFLMRVLPISSVHHRPFASHEQARTSISVQAQQEGVRSISERCRVLMPAPKANVAAEIAKSEKLLVQLRARLAALEAQVGGSTYSARVPLDVQAKNSSKIANMKSEIEKLETTIETLKSSD